MATNFYSMPTYMSGGAFNIYAGARRQFGGGFFSSLRTSLAPVGKNMLKGMKSLAKNKTFQDIAKTAAQKGAEVLTGVAVDALQGQHIGRSLEERSKRAALEALIGNNDSPPPTKRKKIQIRPQNSTRKRVQGLKQKTPLKGKSKKARKRLSRATLNRQQLF